MSRARSYASALNLSRLICYLIVVEVPGIEPGSFGAKTGLLRA